MTRAQVGDCSLIGLDDCMNSSTVMTRAQVGDCSLIDLDDCMCSSTVMTRAQVGNLPTHLFLKPMEPGQEVMSPDEP